VENIDRWRRQSSDGRQRASGVRGRRTAGNVRIGGRQRRGGGSVEGQRLNVDSIIGMGGAIHDRGRCAVEDAIATANDELPALDWLPSKSHARGNIIVIIWDVGSIQSERQGCRVLYRWLGHQFHVVANPEVERQMLRDLPVVLDKSS